MKYVSLFLLSLSFSACFSPHSESVEDSSAAPTEKATESPRVEPATPVARQEEEPVVANAVIAEEVNLFIPSANSVFVHTDGNDANVGTSISPKLTIQGAITYANATYGADATVYVAEGTYLVNATITALPGISILGGYKRDDWNLRNTSLYPTIVTDTREAGGLATSPNSVFLLVGSLGGLVIDSLSVNGGGGTYTAAISTSNAYAYTIQNCVLAGGSGTSESRGFYKYADATNTGVLRNNVIEGGSGVRSFGLSAAGAQGVFSGNTFRGGTGTTNYAAHFDTVINSTISANAFIGGTGTTSYGLYVKTTNGTYSGNVIRGGTGSTTSYGIYSGSVTGLYPLLTENTVHGGTSTTTYGIYVAGTLPTIVKNKIHGGVSTSLSVGIYNSSDSSQIYNNEIFGGESADVAYGIMLFNPNTPKFRNNTISGGKGGTGAGATNRSAAVFIFGPTQLDLQNNILFTTAGTDRYCIYSHGLSGAAVFRMQNNAFSNCGAALYYTHVAPCTGDRDGDGDNRTCNISDINALQDASGNIAADPVFTDEDGADNDISTLADNLWSLSNASHVSILGEGLDGTLLGWGYSLDRAGAVRTGNGTDGWSIGAYERD